MWLTRLYQRFRGLVHELSKFGVVGAIAYVVDTVVFVLLLQVMETLVAGALATAVAATVAFLGNRFWTWRHRARTGLAREYVLYFTFNAIGLLIVLAVLGVSHYGLGAIWPAFQSSLADVVAKNVVGLALGTSFRFWSYRRFVFRERASVSELASGSDRLSRELASGSDKLSRERASVSERESGSDRLSREHASGSDRLSREDASGSDRLSREHASESDKLSGEETRGGDLLGRDHPGLNEQASDQLSLEHVSLDEHAGVTERASGGDQLSPAAPVPDGYDPTRAAPRTGVA